MSLRAYSKAALIAELARREAEPAREPIPHCDECANFLPWQGDATRFEVPKDYNPCTAGVRMSFRLPDDPTDDDWGFFKRGCRDRSAA